jgi:hypothetical protein
VSSASLQVCRYSIGTPKAARQYMDLEAVPIHNQQKMFFHQKRLSMRSSEHQVEEQK